MLFQLTGSQITETYLKEYLLSGRAAERTVVCTWRLPRRRWSMFNLPQDSKRHFYCMFLQHQERDLLSCLHLRQCPSFSSVVSPFQLLYIFKSGSMQQTQRLPIFYFLLVKICHLHHWRCSLFLDTISVNSHVLRFCSIVHTSYSTRRVSESGDRVQWFCWLSILSLFNLNISVCVVL